MIATELCEVPKLIQAYFNSNDMANIIGLGQMRQKYRVMYDSDKEAAFWIHLPNKIIHFLEISDDLYAFDMEKKEKRKDQYVSKKCMVKSTKDNIICQDK